MQHYIGRKKMFQKVPQLFSIFTNVLVSTCIDTSGKSLYLRSLHVWCICSSMESLSKSLSVPTDYIVASSTYYLTVSKTLLAFYFLSYFCYSVRRDAVCNICRFCRRSSNIKWLYFICSVSHSLSSSWLASELQWPIQPNFDSSSTFSFVG